MTHFKLKPHTILIYLLSIFLSPVLSHASEEKKHILLLGDSITAGYGLEAKDSLPRILQNRIDLHFGENKYRIINAGVSGDTSAGGASRISWLLAENPDGVVIALGGNDTLRGLSPEETKSNLRKIIEIVEKTDTPILLAGMMAPRNLGNDYTARFDAIFTELAQDYDVLFYPFLLEGVASIPKYNQYDGIHPNPEGVNIIVSGILPKVKQLILRMNEKP